MTEIETRFTVHVNETYTYQLPEVKDKEDNDEPMVYIKPIDNQPYPQFLSFNNETRQLTFRAESDVGQTFYFSIVLKETNSDTVLYPYYCTVEVNEADPERLVETAPDRIVDDEAVADRMVDDETGPDRM